ncbi:endonuclease/exonuclease/phosphatase family protein [Actinopolyspora mortivallis]|uniref:endonuclease/exonuclease/phosphatase family protein n=1 Tax=Actinopolyspora mortivallis TaxID=33906 RepID=UPI001C6287B1|nr:endonuclease/exonuclease/phosphatase family protein [Actinopolyspora mortivallis]
MVAALVILLGSLLTAHSVPCPHPDAPRSPSRAELRVVQYNIRSGRGLDGRADLERTARTLEALRPDVVGLQEVDVHWSARSSWRDQIAALAERLSMRAFFAPVYTLPPPEPGSPPRRFGTAVLSTLPIVETTNHRMTRVSSLHPERPPRRRPGSAEVVLDLEGTRLHAYSAHLDHRPDPRIRRRQVREALGTLAADPAGEPTVLFGDLNAPARAPELAPLWRRLRTTESPPGRPTYPTRDPRVRIDHIAVSPEVTVSCSATPWSGASDHLPVLAGLSVPSGEHGE